MSICSYLVFPAAGARTRVAERLAGLPGCEVLPAQNADLMILVTDSESAEAEDGLRRRVEAVDEVECLVLTFGEIVPGGEPRRPADGAGEDGR